MMQISHSPSSACFQKSCTQVVNMPSAAVFCHQHQHSRNTFCGASSAGRCSSAAASALSNRRNLHACRAATEPQGTVTDAQLKAKRIEQLRGCKTVIAELAGLDFARNDCKMYFQISTKPPKGMPADFELPRAKVVLDKILAGADEAALADDPEALKAAELMLSEVWRWRRRGGGMQDDENGRPYTMALEQIQNVQVTNIDAVSSSLLDNINLSDTEKRELGQGVQKAAFAGIQGAVWGSLIATLFLIGVLNFVRAS